MATVSSALNVSSWLREVKRRSICLASSTRPLRTSHQGDSVEVVVSGDIDIEEDEKAYQEQSRCQ